MTPTERAAECSERQKLIGILDELVRMLNRRAARGEGMTKEGVITLRNWIVERRRG